MCSISIADFILQNNKYQISPKKINNGSTGCVGVQQVWKLVINEQGCTFFQK